MKRILAPAVFLLLLAFCAARAETCAIPYLELADAPTITVDWSKRTTQAVTLHGNRVLVFENGQKGGKYLLILTQDATGSRTVTWPSSVRWPGYTGQPTFTTLANKTDYVTFFYNGATYDTLALAQNY